MGGLSQEVAGKAGLTVVLDLSVMPTLKSFIQNFWVKIQFPEKHTFVIDDVNF